MKKIQKVQKKFYLPEGIVRKLRLAAARTGLSQSQILEAALVMHMVHTTR